MTIRQMTACAVAVLLGAMLVTNTEAQAGTGRGWSSAAALEPANRVATPAIRQGTTYWVAEDEYGDPAYVKLVRRGSQLKVYGRLPDVIRLHAWAAICAEARFAPDGQRLDGRGSRFGEDLSSGGWERYDDYVIKGRVWREGRTLVNEDLADFTGLGTVNRARSLRPTTYGRSGGRDWKRITTGCDQQTRDVLQR